VPPFTDKATFQLHPEDAPRPRFPYRDFAYALPGMDRQQLFRDYLDRCQDLEPCRLLYACMQLASAQEPAPSALHRALELYRAAHNAQLRMVDAALDADEAPGADIDFLPAPRGGVSADPLSLSQSVLHEVDDLQRAHASADADSPDASPARRRPRHLHEVVRSVVAAVSRLGTAAAAAVAPVLPTSAQIKVETAVAASEAVHDVEDAADSPHDGYDGPAAPSPAAAWPLERFPLLCWRRAQATALHLLLGHALALMLQLLLRELALVRQYRKFWYAHQRPAWYQPHRSLYVHAGAHARALTDVEYELVRLCGRLHAFTMTTARAAPDAGAWRDGPGPLVEAVLQWGPRRCAWELWGGEAAAASGPDSNNGDGDGDGDGGEADADAEAEGGDVCASVDPLPRPHARFDDASDTDSERSLAPSLASPARAPVPPTALAVEALTCLYSMYNRAAFHAPALAAGSDAAPPPLGSYERSPPRLLPSHSLHRTHPLPASPRHQPHPADDFRLPLPVPAALLHAHARALLREEDRRVVLALLAAAAAAADSAAASASFTDMRADREKHSNGSAAPASARGGRRGKDRDARRRSRLPGPTPSPGPVPAPPAVRLSASGAVTVRVARCAHDGCAGLCSDCECAPGNALLAGVAAGAADERPRSAAASLSAGDSSFVCLCALQALVDTHLHRGLQQQPHARSRSRTHSHAHTPYNAHAHGPAHARLHAQHAHYAHTPHTHAQARERVPAPGSRTHTPVLLCASAAVQGWGVRQAWLHERRITDAHGGPAQPLFPAGPPPRATVEDLFLLSVAPAPGPGAVFELTLEPSLASRLAGLPPSLLHAPDPAAAQPSLPRVLLSLIGHARGCFPTLPDPAVAVAVLLSARCSPTTVFKLLASLPAHLTFHAHQLARLTQLHAPPPFYSRYLEPLLAAALALAALAYQAVSHREVAYAAMLDVAESARHFYSEHIAEPVENIYKRVFSAFFEHGSKGSDLPTRAGVYEGRAELTNMLYDFGMEHAMTLAKAEGISVNEFLSSLSGRVDRGDMSIVMHKYEYDVLHPWKGILSGSLVSGLLVQMQKLKVDGESAMLDMDRIMEQNEINFNVMAIMPAALMAGCGLWTINRMVNNVIRRHKNPVFLLQELRETLQKIEVLLITGDQSAPLDERDLALQGLARDWAGAQCTCDRHDDDEDEDDTAADATPPVRARPAPSPALGRSPQLQRHPSVLDIALSRVHTHSQLRADDSPRFAAVQAQPTPAQQQQQQQHRSARPLIRDDGYLAAAQLHAPRSMATPAPPHRAPAAPAAGAEAADWGSWHVPLTLPAEHPGKGARASVASAAEARLSLGSPLGVVSAEDAPAQGCPVHGPTAAANTAWTYSGFFDARNRYSGRYESSVARALRLHGHVPDHDKTIREGTLIISYVVIVASSSLHPSPPASHRPPLPAPARLPRPRPLRAARRLRRRRRPPQGSRRTRSRARRLGLCGRPPRAAVRPRRGLRAALLRRHGGPRAPAARGDAAQRGGAAAARHRGRQVARVRSGAEADAHQTHVPRIRLLLLPHQVLGTSASAEQPG
jgi:hypothetical protein